MIHEKVDPIANMLIQIKNAQLVNKGQVLIPSSKMKFKIAQILKESGFIGEIEKKKRKTKKAEFEYLSISLKYNDDKESGINGFKIISKPSRHMYIGAKDIKPVRSGYGIAVISTSKGVMSSKEARKQNLGGEILFEVW